MKFVYYVKYLADPEYPVQMVEVKLPNVETLWKLCNKWNATDPKRKFWCNFIAED